MFSPMRDRAVHLQARQRLELRVLLHEFRGAVGEGLRVGLRPPVREAAVGRELAALVVEAVADLVADHRADGAVVHGIVRVRIEERRLQDRRREHDLVVLRVVVGVHVLRIHLPLVAIHGAVEARELAMPFPQRRAAHVAEQIVAPHFERGVVLPLVRVADLGDEASRASRARASSSPASSTRACRAAGRAPSAGSPPALPSSPWIPAGSASARTPGRPARRARRSPGPRARFQRSRCFGWPRIVVP